ncbi:MAG: 50S ribosomal protein L22 [Acidimicrobiales bacterium]
MTVTKTNEVAGTRAVLRHTSVPAPKARQVLDLIRGQDAERAAQILRGTSRQAAVVISKVLASAVANAVHNDELDAEDLYVSACYADQGPTAKRWHPRARGRAGRIAKRSCHVTIVVTRMDDDRLARRRAERDADQARRARRVAYSRRRADLSGRLSRRRAAQAEAARRAAEQEAQTQDDELAPEELNLEETETTEDSTRESPEHGGDELEDGTDDNDDTEEAEEPARTRDDTDDEEDES